MVEHAVFEAEIGGFLPHLLHHRVPLRELFFAEAELQPAVALMPDGDASLLAEFGGESGPLLGREAGPALVMRRAEALGLHPDPAEIAARGAVGHIALIHQGWLEPGARQAIADRRADQSAADHDRIEAPHSSHPADEHRPAS